jgi:hypothetical protein
VQIDRSGTDAVTAGQREASPAVPGRPAAPAWTGRRGSGDRIRGRVPGRIAGLQAAALVLEVEVDARRRARRSTSAITGTSAIAGTSERSRGSSVSNEAAISFSAEFLAPDSRTVPWSAAPPRTRNASAGRSGGGGRPSSEPTERTGNRQTWSVGQEPGGGELHPVRVVSVAWRPGYAAAACAARRGGPPRRSSLPLSSRRWACSALARARSRSMSSATLSDVGEHDHLGIVTHEQHTLVHGDALLAAVGHRQAQGTDVERDQRRSGGRAGCRSRPRPRARRARGRRPRARGPPPETTSTCIVASDISVASSAALRCTSSTSPRTGTPARGSRRAHRR